MNSDHLFRNAPFGGFNKEDVLKYIEQIKSEVVVCRENGEQHSQELMKTIVQLQNQLLSARQLINALKSEINELKAKDEELPSSQQHALVNESDDSDDATDKKPEEKDVKFYFESEPAKEVEKPAAFSSEEESEEPKTGGFKIEDSVISEQDGSRFNANGKAEPQAENASEDNKIEETLEDNSAQEEPSGGGFTADVSEIETETSEAEEDEAPNQEQAPVEEKEETEKDLSSELFKENIEEKDSVEDSISKARDTMRELGVMLASFGLSKEFDNDTENAQTKTETESENVEPEKKPEQTKPDGAQKEEKVKDEDEYADLERLMNAFASSANEALSDEDLEKLTDKFADD